MKKKNIFRKYHLLIFTFLVFTILEIVFLIINLKNGKFNILDCVLMSFVNYFIFFPIAFLHLWILQSVYREIKTDSKEELN
jgi:hypothetical protein